MNSTIVSMARETGRLICVWVPSANPRMPLTCIWIEDKHYPTHRIVHSSSIEEVGRMQPCV